MQFSLVKFVLSSPLLSVITYTSLGHINVLVFTAQACLLFCITIAHSEISGVKRPWCKNVSTLRFSTSYCTSFDVLSPVKWTEYRCCWLKQRLLWRCLPQQSHNTNLNHFRLFSVNAHVPQWLFWIQHSYYNTFEGLLPTCCTCYTYSYISDKMYSTAVA